MFSAYPLKKLPKKVILFGEHIIPTVLNVVAIHLNTMSYSASCYCNVFLSTHIVRESSKVL